MAKSWEERETGGQEKVGRVPKPLRRKRKEATGAIPEAKNRSLAGAAGVRFGRDKRPEAAGGRLRCVRVRGSAACCPER